MNTDEDVQRIRAQEQALVLPRLDETVAFELGAHIREHALRENLSLVCDIRTWDRQLFFCATAGTSLDNAEWVRRKINAVKRFQRSSYQLALERGPGAITAERGLDVFEYAFAGGGFPLRVEGAGIVGCLTISGLPQRQDHAVAVGALCAHLGVDAATLQLP